MADLENLGVEEMEVADPSPETPNEDLGAEETEIADQSSEEVSTETGKTDRDSAFAELRRAKEQAERELANYRAEQEAREQAFANISGGDENAVYKALAETYGLEVEEVKATIETEQASRLKDIRIGELEDEVALVRAEKQMAQELAELQKIDPTIKSLEELGEQLPAYINAGLTAKQAYFAIKGEEAMTKPIPPKDIGKLNTNEPAEKEYFTEAEVDAMTPAEQQANYEKIIRSMSRWK